MLLKLKVTAAGAPHSIVVMSAATKLEGPGSNPGSVESCSRRNLCTPTHTSSVLEHRPISHRGQRNSCEARGNKAPGEEPCAGCQKMLPEPPIGAPNQPASKPRPEDAAETKM